MQNVKRKLLAGATVLSLIGAGMIAHAGQIPLITGPVDPSNLPATLNQTIQSVNGNVGSLVNIGTAFATGTGTTEQTAASYTIPGNLLVAGAAMRQTCWGVAANNANVKTAKLYFGGQNSSLTVTASAATQWLLRATTVITNIGASPTNTTLFESTNTAVAPALVNSTGTDNVAGGAVVAKCTLTDATSAAADLTMQGYIVEILH